MKKPRKRKVDGVDVEEWFNNDGYGTIKVYPYNDGWTDIVIYIYGNPNEGECRRPEISWPTCKPVKSEQASAFGTGIAIAARLAEEFEETEFKKWKKRMKAGMK